LVLIKTYLFGFIAWLVTTLLLFLIIALTYEYAFHDLNNYEEFCVWYSSFFVSTTVALMVMKKINPSISRLKRLTGLIVFTISLIIIIQINFTGDNYSYKFTDDIPFLGILSSFFIVEYYFHINKPLPFQEYFLNNGELK